MPARMDRRGFLRMAAAAGLGLVLFPGGLLGCGGGAPRKPTRPDRDDSLRREKFRIQGVADEWHEAPVIIDGLKRMGGVVDCYQDETDGKYVVVYNPQRTHRDAIYSRIVEMGREQNREFEPIFDDR